MYLLILSLSPGATTLNTMELRLGVCSPLYPFLIHQVLSTCQWLHVYKMVSDKNHKSKLTQ